MMMLLSLSVDRRERWGGGGRYAAAKMQQQNVYACMHGTDWELEIAKVRLRW